MYYIRRGNRGTDQLSGYIEQLICAFVSAYAKADILMARFLFDNLPSDHVRHNYTPLLHIAKRTEMSSKNKPEDPGPVNAHLISWPSKAQTYKTWKYIC